MNPVRTHHITRALASAPRPRPTRISHTVSERRVATQHM